MRKTLLFTATALALLGAAVVAFVGRASAGSSSGSALGISIVLGPSDDVAIAHLVTSAGIITAGGEPNMSVGVFGVGAGPAGRTIFYGHIPNLPPSEPLPERPKASGAHATGLEKRLQRAAFKQWKEQYAALMAAWNVERKAAVIKWARTHTGGLVNTPVRSHAPITQEDVAVALLRGATFFQHEGGTPYFVIIGDLPDMPPIQSARNLRFDGVTFVLAGWSYSSPSSFAIKVARWKGFLTSKGAAAVKVLPRGIDTTENIVSALR